MSYTLTLTRDERRAIDWIGWRYWHGSEFRDLLEKCYSEEQDGDTWFEEADVTFVICESIAWGMWEGITSDDDLACFSDDFKNKLFTFAYAIV